MPFSISGLAILLPRIILIYCTHYEVEDSKECESANDYLVA